MESGGYIVTKEKNDKMIIVLSKVRDKYRNRLEEFTKKLKDSGAYEIYLKNVESGMDKEAAFFSALDGIT